jgi:dihydroorotate dehydrogenase electron transfer subunit
MDGGEEHDLAQASGEIVEVWLEGDMVAGQIRCPETMLPLPGQYLIANGTSWDEAALPFTLFPAGSASGGFLTAPGLPPSWQPGTRLNLRGPLGRGFQLPAQARRVTLAALGESPSRLLPLARQAILQGAEVSLFSVQPPYNWPLDVEINPPGSLPDGMHWADYMALDLTADDLRQLREKLALPLHSRAVCPAQALIVTPMPCAGVGECGVCAVRMRRGWGLACKDGPVFDLNQLEW